MPRNPNAERSTDSLYLAGSHPQSHTVPVGADRTEHFVVDLKKRAPNARPAPSQIAIIILGKIGISPMQWFKPMARPLRPSAILEAMQSASDRQRSLARHQAMLSDSRLPISLTDAKQLTEPLEGRVLGHVEDERTGRAYMILEGTDRRSTSFGTQRKSKSARRQRKLGPNAFIRMRPHSAKGKTFLILSDLGPSAELLNNTEHMRNSAQALMKRGIVPVENGWADGLENMKLA